ncbi:MAG: flagellar biosynthetic protein FliO [Pirellulaceae bacterium]|jgi:flagellar biogenesis protein FliO|nr:flagellar biosynthetic protein FliO [Pirellulaceae bacterium]|tara:strand:+ start:19001 stop:19657 length:657 start_codon:yes stop_codon:yes gene_type:complete
MSPQHQVRCSLTKSLLDKQFLSRVCIILVLLSSSSICIAQVEPQQTAGDISVLEPQPLQSLQSFPRLPLQPRVTEPTSKSATTSAISKFSIPNFSQSATRMVAALAVVLGAFMVLLWVTKKIQGPSQSIMSKQTLEVLGQKQINKIHSLHLIRLGQRILLISASDSSVTCLSEINDPVEVTQLLNTNSQAGDSSELPQSTFKRIFAQYEQNPNETFSA